MGGLKKIYHKNRNFIENFLFPVVLFLYPFIGVCQGLDLEDTTYSLANFQYFGQMDGTWMVATFLSNVWGSLLMHLPFGGTMIGMNCYTALVQSAMALMVYLTFRGRMAAPLLFVGELIALGLCWAPSAVLYHYLTYFFLTAGILLLFCGLTAEGMASLDSRSRDWRKSRGENVGAGGRVVGAAGSTLRSGRQRLYFLAAGLCLGANVAVRMPNVVQAALILVVWYGIVLYDKLSNDCYGTGKAKKAGGEERTTLGTDEKVKGTERKNAGMMRALAASTGWCLVGYLAGFGLPFLAICLRYGISAYPDMVWTLFAMTERATDYKPTSMVTGMFGDYGRGLYWLAFAALCMAAAGLAAAVRERLYGKTDNVGHTNSEAALRVRETSENGRQAKADFGKWDAYRITGVIIKAGYCLLLLVLLRFYWGRGMFTFRYYDYTSIYDPTVLLLLVTIGMAIYCLLKKDMAAEKKILAAAVLLEIFLTPLGSNNALYPIINNLFLAVPFLLWVAYDEAARVRRNRRFRVLSGSTANVADGESRVLLPAFLWQIPLALLVTFVLVQSIGFHASFAFNDGVFGEPRDRQAVLPEKAAGVWTNQEQGVLLEELARFAKEEDLSGREVICYGNLPGLSYLLDMPPALSTGWPDLASYRMVEYQRDMEALKAENAAGKELPIVMVSTPVAAYLSDDGEAIVWFGVDMEAYAADEKLQILGNFLREHGYAECFGNAEYVVYRAE